jgi:hypothetical protein
LYYFTKHIFGANNCVHVQNDAQSMTRSLKIAPIKCKNKLYLRNEACVNRSHRTKTALKTTAAQASLACGANGLALAFVRCAVACFLH